MSNVFVVRNQQGQFLNKQKEWQDSGDNRSLLRVKHHDEALNLVFELSSKDIYLRAQAVECELDSSNNPVILDEFTGPEVAANDGTESAMEASAEAVEEIGEADDPDQSPEQSEFQQAPIQAS